MLKMLLKLKLTFLTIIIHCGAKPGMEKFSSQIDVNARSCECVPFLLCENGTEIVNGAGFLDIRGNFPVSRDNFNLQQRNDVVCENFLEVCCEPPSLKSRHKPSLQVGRRGCGVRNFDGIELKITGGSSSDNAAKIGEFPWMVAVLLNTPDQLDVYQCGGALIHRKVVLTAAHCLSGKTASEVKIRVGEWNTQSTDESLPHQDRAVETIIIHERFQMKSLQNDFALLMLNDPVTIADNVDIICLPKARYDFDGTQCTASGWGKNEFGSAGQYQEVLKNIELSITNPVACQRILRNTVLGKNFELDRSFVCATGNTGEDTCKGDGGSPLVCPLRTDRKSYVQVGIVSWGIGCGNADLPGVYSNVLYARPWIDEQLLLHNLDNSIYQHRPGIIKQLDADSPQESRL